MLDLLFTILYPIEYLMGLCFSSSYQVTGSYGVSVIILSLVVNVALLPLYESGRKMEIAGERDQAKDGAGT